MEIASTRLLICPIQGVDSGMRTIYTMSQVRLCLVVRGFKTDELRITCRVNTRRPCVEDYVFPMFRANAIYEGTYLLGTSIARPLIAKRQIEIARECGADAVCHGATGEEEGLGHSCFHACARRACNSPVCALLNALNLKTEVKETRAEMHVLVAN